MAGLMKFAEEIKGNGTQLAEEVVRSVMGRMKLDITLEEEAQALDMYIEVLDFFAESLDGEQDDEVPETMIRWSRKNAEMLVQAEGKLSDIVVRYPPTREVFSDLFTSIAERLDLSLRDLSFILCRIDRILDVSLNETFFAFERLTEQRRREAKQELVRLSAPIVPVHENTVVLPLIGYIDSDRTRHIMNNVVPKIADMRIRHVIIDFSGVMTLDDQTAESMHHIGGTLSLMGIHVAVAGMRPDLVQTAVSSGLDLAGVEAYGNVNQALKSIQSGAHS